MRWEILTPPQTEPLSVSAAKQHLRLDHSDDDTALAQLITVARQYFEQLYSVALIDQTVSVSLNAWPSGQQSSWWDGMQQGAVGDMLGAMPFVSLPVRPAAAIVEVATYDQQDAKSVWLAANYRLAGGLNPRLIKKDGVTWPHPMRSLDGIAITYQAGFGADEADVPDLIKHGMKEMVSYLYMHRGDDLDAAATASGAKTLWSPYRRVKL